MSDVFFSLIVPVYNTSKYLMQCLDSILSQTFKNFEVILVDDGSTDNSGKICDEYCKKHQEVFSVIHKKNGGLISARREGLKAANGRYIWHVDSDDMVRNTALEQVYNIISDFKAEIVLFDYQNINNNGEEKDIVSQDNFEKGFVDYHAFRKKMLLSDSVNSLCIKICESQLVDKYKDYSSIYWLKIGEDFIQSLPIIDKAKKIYYLSEPLYLYRVNPVSMTHTFNTGWFNDVNLIYSKKIEYLKKWNLDTNENKSMVYRNCLMHTVVANCLKYYNSYSDNKQTMATPAQVFSQLKEYAIVKEAQDYINDPKFPWHIRYYLKLFYGCNWKALRIWSLFPRCLINIRAILPIEIKRKIDTLIWAKN